MLAYTPRGQGGHPLDRYRLSGRHLGLPEMRGFLNFGTALGDGMDVASNAGECKLNELLYSFLQMSGIICGELTGDAVQYSTCSYRTVVCPVHTVLCTW